MAKRTVLQTLGQKLRDQRKRLGVSAVAAAEAAGLSRVTLYRIEQGEASVTIGAYVSVASALGLMLELVDPREQRPKGDSKLPKEIRIAEYKQLKKLAWQLKGSQKLSPQEALELYERNWRHVDIKAMDAKEKKLIELLLRGFGRERLLV